MQTKTKLYPLKFNPISKYRMWGGDKLNTVLNKGFEGENIGESWELSAVQGDESEVANGFLEGKTLKQLIDEFKDELLGKSVYETFGTEFPLLIKFIDAKTPLSIQVHPHDEIAKIRHQSFGKNEMWYIMDADENAEIIVGFNTPLTKEKYQEYLHSDRVLEIMNTVKTKAGDAFNIPTGRVHAIGSGVLLAEIQQTSDVTYRIYDYNRIDKATNQKRALHNDLALDVLDFEIQEEYKTNYEKTENQFNELIHTPYFKTNIFNFNQKVVKSYAQLDSFVILIGTKGSAELVVDGQSYQIKAGETLLIPASIDKIEFIPNEMAELLEVYL